LGCCVFMWTVGANVEIPLADVADAMGPSSLRVVP